MKLSTFGFLLLLVKVRSDPNAFHYPKYVLDEIIERAIEDEVNSEFPGDDAKYHNDEGGEFKQKVVHINKVITNEYEDTPSAPNKVNENAQQDQNQRAIPQEIIRKKFLENFFDVERVPEEVIKKSKPVLTKLQDGDSENDYYTQDNYSGDLYSSYKEDPYYSNSKQSEQLKNDDAYPYDSYDKKSDQLKNEDAYPHDSYDKVYEQLKNQDEYAYDYYKQSDDLKNKKSEDKEEIEEKKPKDTFFLQEYSSGYNTEWNEKDSDKNFVPDKKEI